MCTMSLLPFVKRASEPISNSDSEDSDLAEGSLAPSTSTLTDSVPAQARCGESSSSSKGKGQKRKYEDTRRIRSFKASWKKGFP